MSTSACIGIQKLIFLKSEYKETLGSHFIITPMPSVDTTWARDTDSLIQTIIIMGYQVATPSSRSLMAGFHGLIVDDAVMDGFIASCILRQEGYEVTLAKSGLDAVEAVAQTNFDFVLMDMRMPGMDGFEATRRIRQLDGLNGQVPIMALTAMDHREQKSRFFDAGMDGVMSKPIDPVALHITLSRVKQAKPEPTRQPEVTDRHLSRDKKLMAVQACVERHEPINFSKEAIALSRPDWADFSMEGVFWKALSEICLREKIRLVNSLRMRSDGTLKCPRRRPSG